VKKMVKKLTGLLLWLAVLLAFALPTAALPPAVEVAPVEPPVIQQTLYTMNLCTSLSFSGNNAICTSSAQGYPSLATRIEISMTLQERGFLGLWWNDIFTWTGAWNAYHGSLEWAAGPMPSGTYRNRTVYTIYSGSYSETFTEYSPTASH
jgi:hypothetical protein